MAVSLVTGGAGFMGSHVACSLVERGDTVVILDDLSGGFVANIPTGCHFVQGSVTDVALVNKLFTEHRFEYVYHLAAYAAEGLSHFIRAFNYENNVLGSVSLINAAVKHEVKRFVFTSSIAVYGHSQVPIHESAIPQPEDPYGIAKLAVELDLKAAKTLFNLPYTIFRPHNVYGERQNLSDPYRNVLGIFINNILSGKPLPIFGDGLQTRAFSYVGDVAPIIARCVLVPEAENEIFNIGADNPYTILELAEEVGRSTGLKPTLCFHPPRNEVRHAYADHKKCTQVFGQGANTSLPVGVNRMAEWAKAIGTQPRTAFSSIELTKNMPPSWQALLEAVE